MEQTNIVLTVCAAIFTVGAAILLIRVGISSSIPKNRISALRRWAVVLAVLAIAVGIGAKYVVPPPPVVSSLKCSLSGDYAPVEVRCSNQSSNADTILWRFENGESLEAESSITRPITSPGDYKIELVASAKASMLWDQKASTDSFAFHVTPRPLPPEVRTRQETISLSSGGVEVKSLTSVIKSSEGFKIIDYKLTQRRSGFGEVVKSTLAKDGASLEIALQARGELSVRGFKIRRRAGRIEVLVTITEQELQ